MSDEDHLGRNAVVNPNCVETKTDSTPAYDDDDHGYHTPRNVFNADISRLSQLQLSCAQPADSEVEDEENPYSTIKKSPIRSTMLKNLETLIEKNTQQLSRSIFYHEVSMDNMLRDLESAALSKRWRLMDQFDDIDRIDIALFVSFVLLVIFGFTGFYILINEF
ncbi:hypothetical protein Q1695_006356 [Nippostrongylus brasiliensis]|nr:hypothetical protein Q1695_006356 [Nippostrongylus brasiliensis]